MYSTFLQHFIALFELSIRSITYQLFGIWFLINWLCCPEARHFIGHPICTHTPLIFIWSLNPLESHTHTHTHSNTLLLVFTVNWPTGSIGHRWASCVCVCTCYEHKYFSLSRISIELTNCQHACCLATGVRSEHFSIKCVRRNKTSKFDNLLADTHAFAQYQIWFGSRFTFYCVKYDCSCRRTNTHTYVYVICT